MVMGMTDESGYIEGQLLIAMPTMTDPRFERTVIFLCAHSAAGAMGLVINKPLTNITFPELIEQLGIQDVPSRDDIRLHFGGPVETGRGLVLHSTDYVREATVKIGEEVALTATVDVLKAIADDAGPDKTILALGYAGWRAGQLEGEIQANGWLHCEADSELIFAAELDKKWSNAINKLGIDPSLLSMDAGHA